MEDYQSAKEPYVIRSHIFLSTLLVVWHQSMLHVHQRLFCKLLQCGRIIVKLSVWVRNFCKWNQHYFQVFNFNFLRLFSKINAENIHFLILALILFKISIWLKSMLLISMWLTHMSVWNLINTSIFLRYENWKQQRVKQYWT